MDGPISHPESSEPASPLPPGPRPGVLGRGGGYQILVEPEVFAATAAAFLARRLTVTGPQGTLSLALSGGSTPGPVYEALARERHPDWDRIDVYFADERVLPLDHPQSNFRLAKETLLDRVGVADARVHPLPTAAPNLDAAARAYGDALPDRLDLLVLGIGGDGHTASLFPHSPALEATERVVRTRAPVAPFDRLTITPPVIRAARLVVVLARGPEKARALQTALREKGSIAECPARLARSGVWILGKDTVATAAPSRPLRVED